MPLLHLPSEVMQARRHFPRDPAAACQPATSPQPASNPDHARGYVEFPHNERQMQTQSTQDAEERELCMIENLRIPREKGNEIVLTFRPSITCAATGMHPIFQQRRREIIYSQKQVVGD